MSEKQKQKKSADLKIRKKRWVQIVAPYFNDQIIGETHIFEPAESVGKTVDINLMYLIGDPRKQNTHVSFKTTQLRGETTVVAELTGLQVQEPSLRKLVRRGKTKVTASFKTYAADNSAVCVKFFGVTRSLVNVSVAQKIRRIIKQILLQKLAAQNFPTFMQGVINNSIVKEIKGTIDKVYPLRVLEIYSVSLVPAGIGTFEKPSSQAVIEQTEDADEETEESESSEESSDNNNEPVVDQVAELDQEEASKEKTE